MITFRKIKPDDAAKVVDLMNQLGYEVNQDNLSKIVKLILQNDDGTAIVALNDQGKVVGSLQISITNRLAEGNYGEIVSLVVDQNERGKGIGKGLVNESTTWLAKKGYPKIRVRCNVIRLEAHKFYECLDFAEKKTQKIFEKVIIPK
jgi:predicted N-acetyltransferase YhbS